MKKYLAELVGTAILVIIGCGTAIFAGSSVGVLGVALAFGLALVLVTYLIGTLSGAHVNPAVTIALALVQKFPWNKVAGYVIAQILGALIGASILYAIASNLANASQLIINGGFATNVLHGGVSVTAGALVEIFMTMIFCLVVLATTRSNWPSTWTPIASGLALFAANLVAIPLTGASINPARSIGPALVSGHTSGLTLFIVAPLVGAVLAYFVHIFVIGKGHFHYEN